MKIHPLWRWLLGVGLVAWGWKQGWLTFDLPSAPHFWNWIPAVLSWLAAYAASIWRWRIFLVAGGPKISWREVIVLSLKATFFSTFLPGGVAGDVYRIASSDAGERMRRAWTVWADRWTGLLGLVLWVAVTLPFLNLEMLRGLGFEQLDRALMVVVAALASSALVTWWLQRRMGLAWSLWTWSAGVGLSVLSHGLNMASLLWIATWLAPQWAWMPLFLLLTSVPQLLPAGVGTGHWIAVALWGWAGVSERDAAGLYSLYALGLMAWGLVGAGMLVSGFGGSKNDRKWNLP